MIGDKRTLALMMVAPLVILTLMNLLFTSNNNPNLKIGSYNLEREIVTILKDNSIDVIEYQSNDNVNNKIKEDKLAAFINMNGSKLDVTYENSDASKTAKVNAKLQGALTKLTMEKLNMLTQKQQETIKNQQQLLLQASGQSTLQSPAQAPVKYDLAVHYLYGDENSSFFDSIIPVLIGFFVFFFVFLISGIALLKERTSGTLDKVLSTPTKRSQLIFGYLIGYGLFAILQTFVVVVFAVYILNIEITGNISLVLLTNIILAFVALSFGILLSTFANSEFQMMQFIPIAVIPQIFFSGIISVDGMANWLQVIAKIMPMYYAGNTLQGIMIKGQNFSDIKSNLFILLSYVVVFTVLNIVGLKRYRKI
jgi:ABC-2 type transport system permease protein